MPVVSFLIFGCKIEPSYMPQNYFHDVKFPGSKNFLSLLLRTAKVYRGSYVFGEVNITDVANIARYMDSIKRAGKAVMEAFLKVDFGLQDKSCDAEELKNSCSTTRMPDGLISFFSVLVNIKKQHH